MGIGNSENRGVNLVELVKVLPHHSRQLIRNYYSMVNLQPNACDFCRRRKLKCSREASTCDKCIRYGKDCIYSQKNRRLSLTKANVQYLQNRISKLEDLLGKLVSDKSELKELISVTKLDSSVPTSLGVCTDQLTEEEELLLDEVDDIDNIVWVETDKSTSSTSPISDGMSALGIEHSNLKIPIYYGLSSSNGLIRYLQKTDINTKRNILEKYKPLSNDVNYRTNLESVKHAFGEGFLDNGEFHSVLFSCYFNTYHKCYPLLHRSSFMKDYLDFTNKQTKLHNSFKLLILAVLAIGSYCKYGDESVIDLLYYQKIKTEMKAVDIMEYNSFYLLEALTLIGNYCQKRNKPNTGWNYHGICFRMAISFGLHREINVDSKKMNDKTLSILERRRRIFWGLYVLDVGHCITLGRPIVSPSLESINIGFPTVDFDYNPGNNKVDPNLIEGFVLEMKLLTISTRINNVLTSLDKNLIIKATKLLDLNDEILEFANNIPAYFKDFSVDIPEWFQFRRVKLIWRYKNMQVLMFRNYIWQLNRNRNSSESNILKTCVSTCLQVSLDTIDDINKYLNFRDLDYFSSWYGIYFLFHAVLVPILVIYNLKDLYSLEEISQFKHYIQLASDLLFKLKKYNSMTGNLINLIEILSSNIPNKDDLVSEIFENNLGEFSLYNGYEPVMDLSGTSFNQDPVDYLGLSSFQDIEFQQ